MTSDQSASEDKSLANWVDWQKADILHFNQITISGPSRKYVVLSQLFSGWTVSGGLILKSKEVEQEGKGRGETRSRNFIWKSAIQFLTPNLWFPQLTRHISLVIKYADIWMGVYSIEKTLA